MVRARRLAAVMTLLFAVCATAPAFAAPPKSEKSKTASQSATKTTVLNVLGMT